MAAAPPMATPSMTAIVDAAMLTPPVTEAAMAAPPMTSIAHPAMVLLPQKRQAQKKVADMIVSWQITGSAQRQRGYVDGDQLWGAGTGRRDFIHLELLCTCR